MLTKLKNYLLILAILCISTFFRYQTDTSSGIQTMMTSAEQDLEKWKELVKDSNISVLDRKFKVHEAKLKNALNDIESSLKELSKSIKAAENRRDKREFQHIDDVELKNRYAFIENIRDKVKSIHRSIKKTQQMNKKESKKMNKKKNKLKETSYNKLDANSDTEIEGLLTGSIIRDAAGSSSTKYTDVSKNGFENKLVEQDRMMFQQDILLDELGKDVKRVGQHAETINIEIRNQTRMLDDFEVDLAEAQKHMDITKRQLSKLLKTKDHCLMNTILFLVLAVVMLLILLIFA